MTYGDLAEKVVFISGAGSGIGKATAREFATNGVRVAGIGRTAETLESTTAEIVANGGEALAIRGDVADEQQVEAAIQSTIDRFGRIDVLVNNAFYGGRRGSITTAEAADWNRVLGTNVLGAMFCAKHVAPHFIERQAGVIVNVSSLAAKVPRIGLAAYCASKAALEQLTRVLALELGEFGIRVNAVSPGSTRTEALEMSMQRGGDAPGLNDRIRGSLHLYRSPIVLGRLGEPEDQARTIVFLASDAARFITGQILYVDGGAGMV